MDKPDEYTNPLLDWYDRLIEDVDNYKYKPNCVCKTYGQEDGDYTCWVHHNCTDGTCTHME